MLSVFVSHIRVFRVIFNKWQMLSIQVILKWSVETFQDPFKIQFAYVQKKKFRL